MFHAQLLPFDAARVEHTATLLATGDVLLTGGLDAMGKLRADCLRFVVATGRFEAAAPLPAPSRRHSATLLADGAVLVVGIGEAIGGAAIYDPTSDSWRTVASPATPRVEHAAAPWAKGEVLICGGRAVATLAGLDEAGRREAPIEASAERYDVAAGIWRPAPAFTTARRKHELVVLGGGALLAVSGKGRGPSGAPVRLGTSERLDAAATAWQPPRKLDEGERFVCVLQDGNVLGQNGHLYDAKAGRWSLAEAGFRGGGPMVVLSDGRVASFGASGDEVFDLDARLWTPVGPTRATPLRGQLATLLNDGRVLVSGGFASRGQGATYAAMVEVDLAWQPPESDDADNDSAEKLLQMLVESESLELEDDEEGIDALCGPVARVLRYVEGPGNQANALVRLLLDHDAVADFYLDDQKLKRLLAQW